MAEFCNLDSILAKSTPSVRTSHVFIVDSERSTSRQKVSAFQLYFELIIYFSHLEIEINLTFFFENFQFEESGRKLATQFYKRCPNGYRPSKFYQVRVSEQIQAYMFNNLS